MQFSCEPGTGAGAGTQLLPGVPNFRDIGGLVASDGRRVRSGLLYRSGHLGHLGEADQQALHALGIRLVCDLRTNGERARLANRSWAGPAPAFLALDTGVPGRAARLALFCHMKRYPNQAGGEAAMAAAYRTNPKIYHGHLASLFEAIIDAGGVPAVVHCHAGKDRTGFVVAMILLALGIPLESIVDDYMMTARFLPEGELGRMQPVISSALGFEAPLPLVASVMGVKRDYLTGVVDAMVAQYGSVDAYLEQGAGLTPVRRVALCALFLHDD